MTLFQRIASKNKIIILLSVLLILFVFTLVFLAIKNVAPTPKLPIDKSFGGLIAQPTEISIQVATKDFQKLPLKARSYQLSPNTIEDVKAIAKNLGFAQEPQIPQKDNILLFQEDGKNLAYYQSSGRVLYTNDSLKYENKFPGRLEIETTALDRLINIGLYEQKGDLQITSSLFKNRPSGIEPEEVVTEGSPVAVLYEVQVDRTIMGYPVIIQNVPLIFSTLAKFNYNLDIYYLEHYLVGKEVPLPEKTLEEFEETKNKILQKDFVVVSIENTQEEQGKEIVGDFKSIDLNAVSFAYLATNHNYIIPIYLFSGIATDRNSKTIQIKIALEAQK